MKTKFFKVFFTGIMEVSDDKPDEEKVADVKSKLTSGDTEVNVVAVSGFKVFYDGAKYVHENSIDEAMDCVLKSLSQFRGDAYVTGVEVIREHCFDT